MISLPPWIIFWTMSHSRLLSPLVASVRYVCVRKTRTVTNITAVFPNRLWASFCMGFDLAEDTPASLQQAQIWGHLCTGLAFLKCCWCAGRKDVAAWTRKGRLQQPSYYVLCPTAQLWLSPNSRFFCISLSSMRTTGMCHNAWICHILWK